MLIYSLRMDPYFALCSWHPNVSSPYINDAMSIIYLTCVDILIPI